MTSRWWTDDEELLAALGRALEATRDVPHSFVEAGKAVYVWHNIDAELADLTYDSSGVDRAPVALTRAESASLRALTFSTGRVAIELEVSADALVGQVVPPQSGVVELQAASGETRSTDIDEVGCFLVRPLPTGAFRLHCRTAPGHDVITNWITL